MVQWAVAIHGGAGDIPKNLVPSQRIPRENALRAILQFAVSEMKAGKAPLDVVESVIRKFEDCEYFNAGTGSVLTTEGTVAMDACIMDGTTRNCGVVSGVSTVVHPISLARLVMEKTPHVYLGFEGAEEFARVQGAEIKDPLDFITAENVVRLKQAKEANQVQLFYSQPTNPIIGSNGRVTVPPPVVDINSQIGTTGCVVVDRNGKVAAATSTGGLVNKMIGRIGDSPVVGAGTYANNFCAVSVTGHGEESIRSTVGRTVSALMEYKGLTLKEAAAQVIDSTPKGSLGLISVSAKGEVATPFNTTGMFRGYATEDGSFEIAIW